MKQGNQIRMASLLLACWGGFLALPALADAALTLPSAIALAQQYDPWLEGSRYREHALRDEAVAAGQLPNPGVSITAANLPVDSFDTSAEPMTQLKLGVSQVFPRGDSRQLRRREKEEMGEQAVLLRDDRRARIARQVSELWLDVARYTGTIALIERDRVLFEQMVDLAESSYRNALGRSRQQDLVQAQLELTRLEDRLAMLRQQQEVGVARLREWLPSEILPAVSGKLPDIDVTAQDYNGVVSPNLLSLLLAHPAIRSLDIKIQQGSTGVELARQNYRPQWGVNAAYAYRDEDLLGRERSDFFSVGVSFDLPLFAEQREDRTLAAAQAQREALKTDRELVLRALRAGFEAASQRLRRLNQRLELYRTRLLQESHEQAEAALGAYTSDDGDFSEVLRARIAELDANIDYLNLQVDQRKTKVELNYYLVASGPTATGDNGGQDQ